MGASGLGKRGTPTMIADLYLGGGHGLSLSRRRGDNKREKASRSVAMRRKRKKRKKRRYLLKEGSPHP